MARRPRRFRPVKSEVWSWQHRWVNRTLTNGHVTSQSNATTTHSRNFSRTAAEVPRWKERLEHEPVLTGELHASVSETGTFPFPAPSYTWAYRTKSTGVVTAFDGELANIAPPSPGALDPGLVVTAENAAIANFLSRYHYATRAVQGLVVLGEIRETMQLLHRPAEAIGSGLLRYAGKAGAIVKTYLRSPTKKILKDSTKKLADEYLGFVFGIAPALADIGAAAEYYGRWNDRKEGFIAIRGRGRAEQANPPFLQNQLANGVSWNIVRHISAVSQGVDVKLRSALRVEAGPGPDPVALLSSTNRLLGTGVRDFLPALWELAPWSFFVDYLFNVQEIIDAFSYATAFPDGIQRTQIRQTRGELYGFHFDPVPPSTVEYIYGNFESEANISVRTKQIDRVKLLALPIPTLQVNLGLSLRRWGNIIALARGNLPSYTPRTKPNITGSGYPSFPRYRPPRAPWVPVTRRGR